MLANNSSKLIPQLVMLLLALGGWTAFAGTYFGMIHAQKRAQQAESELQEARKFYEDTIRFKNETIKLLELKADQQGSRP